MTRAESAAALMAAGTLNCAQAVLTAYCEDLGLDRDLALKLALGFGGGLGRSGKTCGAVTGACMVIGLKQQNLTPESKDKVYQLIRDFTQKFSRIYGSVTCKKLLGYDLSQPEDLAEVREKGLFSTLCPRFVSDAINILEKM